MVRITNGFDNKFRDPLADSRRGRGTVEHIFILRNIRDCGMAENVIDHVRELREGLLLCAPKEPLRTHGELRNPKQFHHNYEDLKGG